MTSASSLLASTGNPAAPTDPSEKPAAYSSSAAVTPEAPAAPQAKPEYGAGKDGTTTKPFSSVGLAVKVGVGGIGFDVATPVAKHFNVRAGASFFSYSHTFLEDGESVNAQLSFNSGNASLDYYPFHNGFRISPGLIFYNDNHVSGNVTVPGGSTFTLNDVDYISSATDPVKGTLDVKLGNKAAPSFTIGWGNMIPRGGKHWSVPFEIGFEYISAPTVTLNLTGSACQKNFSCPVYTSIATDPTTQANLKGEQTDFNNDLSALKLYPIMSIGFSYKFGK